MMPRLLVLCMAVLIASAVCGQERLYVVQYADESLAEIRLASGAVNSHVLDLGYGCNDIVVSGNRLFVTNSLQNTVQEIDAEANATLRDIPTVGGINPYSLAVLNHDTIAVTNWISNNVLLIRLTDGSVVGDIPVGVAPQGIVAHGNRVFVCLTRYESFGVYGPGVVLIFDRTGFQLLDSLEVAMNPQTALVDDQNRLHVVCTGNYADVPGEIHVINLDTPDIHTALPIGGTPMNISFGGGQAVVAAGGWGASGEVYRYRLADLTILNDAATPLSVGVGATDVEAMPDGIFFVSCSMEDIVEYRDSAGGLLRHYLVSDGPGQIALFSGPTVAESLVPQIIVKDLVIEEAYPNPFNSVVRFRLSGVSQEVRKIRIFNEIGQLVDEVEIAPGTVEVGWNPGYNNASYLSSGFYIARLDDGGGGKTAKVLFVK